MFDKICDGNFSIYKVDGLDVFVLRSEAKGYVEVFVRYKDYSHISFVCGFPLMDFEEEKAINAVRYDFANVMRMYWNEVYKLEV